MKKRRKNIRLPNLFKSRADPTLVIVGGYPFTGYSFSCPDNGDGTKSSRILFRSSSDDNVSGRYLDGRAVPCRVVPCRAVPCRVGVAEVCACKYAWER